MSYWPHAIPGAKTEVITLELFEGQKNIFGDSFPVEASRRKDFAVIAGAVTPVPLYEFEVGSFLLKRR